MSVFVRPGAVCAADRREGRFDSAFHRNNSLVLFSPLPVGLGESGLSQRAGSSQQTLKGFSGQRFPTSASTATVTAQGASRNLTPGEMAMSRRLFGDSIDYGRVKVHNAEYLPFGMQRNNTVMTPNGEMYFPKGIFREDFSFQRIDRQHLFMHEMTHVWQRQMGMRVLLRGLLSWAARYKYTLSVNQKLSNYGMEQQASLLADYYILIVHGYAAWDNLRGCKNPSFDILLVYKIVLSDFIKNPADRSVL